jgi:hypothetical protein
LNDPNVKLKQNTLQPPTPKLKLKPLPLPPVASMPTSTASLMDPNIPQMPISSNQPQVQSETSNARPRDGIEQQITSLFQPQQQHFISDGGDGNGKFHIPASLEELPQEMQQMLSNVMLGISQAQQSANDMKQFVWDLAKSTSLSSPSNLPSMFHEVFAKLAQGIS